MQETRYITDTLERDHYVMGALWFASSKFVRGTYGLAGWGPTTRAFNVVRSD